MVEKLVLALMDISLGLYRPSGRLVKIVYLGHSLTGGQLKEYIYSKYCCDTALKRGYSGHTFGKGKIVYLSRQIWGHWRGAAVYIVDSRLDLGLI